MSVLRLENDFDGANPSGPGGVEMLAPDRALVRPWSEDGDGNYKFCLNVRVVNDADAPAPLTLQVDWADPDYMDDRGYVLLGAGEQWQSIDAQVAGTVATARLTVPPGAWHVGLHPVYGLDLFAADRARAVRAGFTEQVYGQSHDGRELVALTAGPDDAPAVFATCRFHPYETAGSFAVAGILDAVGADLAGDGRARPSASPLTDFRFVVVPMPNPDGTVAGCCKRTRAGGPDLCHEGADSSDPAGAALADLLARTAPAGYLDFHGWMHRVDGVCYPRPADREAIAAADPPFTPNPRESFWGERAYRPGDFWSRCWHNHGALGLVISPTWFTGRSVEQMRRFGAGVCRSLCRVLRDRG